ncbi:MAG: helix-turn-helix domain-containing protein [Vulcanimicrobiota bacterium]
MAYFGAYVTVAEKRAKAEREMSKLRKKGMEIQPVKIEGRLIARSFWGKGWCTHLESFSDYANRLPRGRSYARNGSVCHLAIEPGVVKAKVSGSSMYDVEIRVTKLEEKLWEQVKDKCSGQIGSLIELLQGKLSHEVMSVVSDRQSGLFPKPKEIKLSCSCPDWATMCKHVAAVLYGVGNRLDEQPDLLFLLREVDPAELLVVDLVSTSSDQGDDALPDEQLSDIFGIDLDFDLDFEANETPQEVSFQHGTEVKALRERLGLSGPEFARRLGVTAASVYRWERSAKLNLRPESLEALKKLAGKS